MAIVHPFLMGTVWPKGIYDPSVGYDLDTSAHPSPPSPGHLPGTDTLGRDVFSILLAAARPAFVMLSAVGCTMWPILVNASDLRAVSEYHLTCAHPMLQLTWIQDGHSCISRQSCP